MSESLTFHANRAKSVLLLFGCIAFVVGGYTLRADRPLVAWAMMIFFGLGIPLLLVMVFSPRSSYLRLDPEGFEMGSIMAKKRIKWTDVQGFRMGSIRGAKMIEIIYAPSYNEQAAYRAVASNLSGMEGAIPNNYNAPLDEILKTLNEWRARYSRAA